MSESWSLPHSKSNIDINPAHHLFERDSKVNIPNLGGEAVTLSIPDITRFDLVHIKLDMSFEGNRRFNDSSITKTNLPISLKQSGVDEQDRAASKTSINEGSINDYPEMDYNQWVQGCPETIQGGPYDGCPAFFGAHAENSESELVLVNPPQILLEMRTGHDEMLISKNSRACLKA